MQARAESTELLGAQLADSIEAGSSQQQAIEETHSLEDVSEVARQGT